jgi:hypothetical protein
MGDLNIKSRSEISLAISMQQIVSNVNYICHNLNFFLFEDQKWFFVDFLEFGNISILISSTAKLAI